jgi:hypothetical protein
VFFILDSPRKADLGFLDFYIKGGGPARKEKHHFLAKELKYHISSYSFRGIYSFLNFEIHRSQYINVQKLFKGGNYMRIYGIYIL